MGFKPFLTVAFGLLLSSTVSAAPGTDAVVSGFPKIAIGKIEEAQSFLVCTETKGVTGVALGLGSSAALTLEKFNDNASDKDLCFKGDSCKIWDAIGGMSGDNIKSLMDSTIKGDIKYEGPEAKEGQPAPTFTYYGSSSVIPIKEANKTVTEKVKPIGGLYFSEFTVCSSQDKNSSAKAKLVYKKKDTGSYLCKDREGSVVPKDPPVKDAKLLGEIHLRLPEAYSDAILENKEKEEGFSCSGTSASFVAMFSFALAMASFLGLVRN